MDLSLPWRNVASKEEIVTRLWPLCHNGSQALLDYQNYAWDIRRVTRPQYAARAG